MCYVLYPEFADLYASHLCRLRTEAEESLLNKYILAWVRGHVRIALPKR